MGEKLVHKSVVHVMQKPPKSTKDKLEEHTEENGDIICLYCKGGYLKEETRDILVAKLTEKPKLIPLSTLFCDDCGYIHMDDQEVTLVRELLSN